MLNNEITKSAIKKSFRFVRLPADGRIVVDNIDEIARNGRAKDENNPHDTPPVADGFASDDLQQRSEIKHKYRKGAYRHDDFSDNRLRIMGYGAHKEYRYAQRQQ